MLRLILGTDWVAIRETILHRIADDVKKEQGGRILMVPELISHDTERRLCLSAGDTASRFAEVLSFTRLAGRVAEHTHTAPLACMDNGGRVVAMAAAARQLHSRLKAYAAVETKPEFLTEMVDAVDECKRCCITPQDLMAASAMAEGSLAQKLEELALLLEAYDGLCAQGKRDPRDQMTWLLTQLEDSDFGENHVFYIDGFPDFTRQHLAILEHLIRVSPAVTVGLNCDRPGSSAMAFEKAGETARELLRCAQRAGVEVRVETVSPQNNDLTAVCDALFQGTVPQVATGCVTALRADSLWSEVSAAADKIMELVRSGCRYRDISLVCGDMNAYKSAVSLVFRRYGIPVYLSGTEDILQKNVVSAVLSALEAALGGFEQRSVLRYLRSVLSPLDPDTCDRVENYAILWGVRGSLWHKEWENHPDGLGELWTDNAQKRLEQLNDARIRALEPLKKLSVTFTQAQNVAGQVQALYAFLEELQLARQLDRLARQLDDVGDNRSAQILDQLWEILLTALEQLHDVLGRTAWEPEIFTRLLTTLLSQYDVGTIPPVLDAVTAGPVSAMRCQMPQHLLVLGMEEGLIPGYGGTTGLLTDQERVTLRSLGVPLTGGNLEGLQAEFAEVYGVFRGARKSITVSCGGGQPSYVYRRLAKMAGCEETAKPSFGPAISSEAEAGAYLAKLGQAEAAAVLGVGEAYETIRNKADFAIGKMEKQQVHGLYGDSLNLSASQVDRQAECRMSYFLKYGMRAKERKEATVDPAEFGTYVHAVLENTAREVMERGGFHAVSMEETMDIAFRYADEYAAQRFSQLESSRLQYLFHRNRRELEMVVEELWKELKDARFAPSHFELAFGGDGEMEAIGIPAKEMSAVLRGFVDRVDLWNEDGRNYFRVVDYKTGKKDFDYCDVYNGVGLQMLLYLFALERSGEKAVGQHATAAGVQYFPARAPLVTADGRLSDEEAEQLRLKEWKRKGLLLQDDDVLQAMEPGDEMSRLCCTRKKDGTLSGDLATREQLRLLEAYVFGILGDMVDSIASGDVTPNPYTRGSSHDACAFCPYGAVCHKNSVEGRRNYKAMTAREFWEYVEKEVQRRG